MTKSLRGAANIRKFNEEREQQAISLIKNELAKCKKHKLTFKTLGALAEYLGATTGIHRTTFMRNPRYKTLLTGFAGIEEPDKSTARDEDAPPEVLRARMLALRLENSNLQEKLKRIEAYVLRKGEQPPRSASTQEVMPPADTCSSDYLAFVDTAMALTALIERLKDSIVIDFQKRTIEDLAARPSQRVVVGPERATPYLDWLKEQKHLMLGVSNGSE